MRVEKYEPLEHPPPSFTKASNLRQKTRAAGLNPNYWYAVEQEKKVKRGGVKEVRFWKRTIALYRGKDGKLRALAGRCLHRQLNLCHGVVDGDRLVCPYHGWAYNDEGKVVDMVGEQISTARPKLRLYTYPLRVRYGLIWIFPGDPELADQVAMPEIPELELESPWPHVLLDFDWKGHHSLIFDNVSDFTHAYLHRRYKPFWQAKLTKLEAAGDKVFVSYDTKVGGGDIYTHFVERMKANTNHIDLCYDYPYQRSNTGDWVKHWMFVLPQDERTSRTFFIFCIKKATLPFTGFGIPNWLMAPVMAVAKRLLFAPLLGEDLFAVEAEQEGYDLHYNSPPMEMNPAVREFQKVTVRKWQEYLDEVEAAEAAS